MLLRNGGGRTEGEREREAEGRSTPDRTDLYYTTHAQGERVGVFIVVVVVAKSSVCVPEGVGGAE